MASSHRNFYLLLTGYKLIEGASKYFSKALTTLKLLEQSNLTVVYQHLYADLTHSSRSAVRLVITHAYVIYEVSLHNLLRLGIICKAFTVSVNKDASSKLYQVRFGRCL